VTGPEIMAVVGFIVMLFGAIFGIWKYLDGKLTSARKETESIARDLAAHKLHAAETFATKQGMQEQTSQMLRAIEGVASRIDGISERLDNILLQRPSTRRSS